MARRVPGDGPDRYLLTSGTRAGLPAGSPLSGHEWLAVAEVSRAQGRDAAGTGAVIRSAAPLTADTAEAAARHLLSDTRGGAVQPRPGHGPARTPPGRDPALVHPGPALRGGGPGGRGPRPGKRGAGGPSDGRRRPRRCAAGWPSCTGNWAGPGRTFPSRRCWPGWTSGWRPELEALAGGAATAGIDLAEPLSRLLPWPEAARLEELAPEQLEVPSGSRIRIDYPDVEDGGRPVVAVKLQECFGWAETPRLADGRVPVLFHLLSPARRPLAVTDDLASFWSGPYAQVRAEMRGRYPKHPWPEDPWTATATARTKPRS